MAGQNFRSHRLYDWSNFIIGQTMVPAVRESQGKIRKSEKKLGNCIF